MIRQCRYPIKKAARQVSLMVDPLMPENISKSVTKTRFPRPKLVSFDLWGTLFTPKKPIAQQYHNISQGEFGIDKLVQSIENEYPHVFTAMLREHPNYGKYSDDIESSNEWWLELIRRLYRLPKEDAQAQELCRRLIDHFSGKEAYRLYEDVVPALRTLEQNNVRIVGATNSDHRIFPILESLGIARYFPASSTYLSYDMGVAKPSKDFFRTISNEYYIRDNKDSARGRMPQFLENVWHVGDHYEQDFVGAVKAGWNAVLVDRNKDSIFLRKTTLQQLLLREVFDETSPGSLDSDELVMITNNRVCVSEIGQILRLFGYDK